MGIAKSVIVLIFVAAIGCNSLNGQYLVGKSATEIKAIMKKDYPLLKLNTSDRNDHFKYLKYEDRINEITILFFLDEKDFCKMERMMYDYSNINDVLAFIQENMREVGKNKYEYVIDRKRFLVEMSEGDWFFTLTVKKK